MTMLERLKARAHLLKRDTYALLAAYHDPRTPWYARVFSIAVAAYLISPIDLIPDFIPVFGYLDDLIIGPAGIALAIKMIPPEVMADARAVADEQLAKSSPSGWIAAATIILIWLVALFFIGRAVWNLYAAAR